MARKPISKSVYDRIKIIETEIKNTETHLNELNSQLSALFLEKDELEMRQAWKMIKEKGLSVDELEYHLQNVIS